MADQATINGTIIAQKIASTFPNDVQYSTALVDALNSGFISNPTFENTQIAPNTFGLSLSFQFFDVENVFILLIGSIGLIIIVSRSLVDRRREIATLRARGLEAKELLKLLAGEGTTLVILGTFVGLVGILVGYTLNIQLGSIALFGLIPRPFVIPGSMALQVGLVVSILLVTVWLVSWREVRHTETPSIAAALRVYS
ncbi:MAG TPA: ABC transporter permease [Candidatus Lokiarchaeia archaeon]|nr:ABC transporter permease [Candidatus Lokiarchaeia archaeon]